jgi:hypothetical protein
MWSVPSLYKKQWRLFQRLYQENVVKGSSVVNCLCVIKSVVTNCSYDVWNYPINRVIQSGTNHFSSRYQDTRDSMNSNVSASIFSLIREVSLLSYMSSWHFRRPDNLYNMYFNQNPEKCCRVMRWYSIRNPILFYLGNLRHTKKEYWPWNLYFIFHYNVYSKQYLLR